MDERLLLKPEEAFRQVGIGRTKGFGLLKGEWKEGVVRIGRSTRISAEFLRKWCSEKAGAAA